MTDTTEQTSKLISYWLRHNPGDGGLVIDDFGWTSINELLVSLNSKNIEIDLQSLNRLNKNFDKVRWEIDAANNKIRATHGHSFPVLLNDKVKTPPETLFHGTSTKNVIKIAKEGLVQMDRQFVHLSETVETAISVGKRHGKPILIEIDTERLTKEDWKFYQTSDNVWLTSNIPVKYLSFRPWFPINEKSNYGLDELKREIGDRTSHFLYPHLNDLNMVWQSSASDDTLFQDYKTGECFMVHLTYTKKKQEVEGWPYIEKYKTIDEWIEKGLYIDQQNFHDLK